MTQLYTAIMILLIFNEALFLWITAPTRSHPPSSVTPQRRMLR